MLTSDQLQSIMPRLPAQKNSQFLPFLTAAMTEFGIESPPRAAAFIAQLAHESGQFRFMEELWGPTDAQRRYEPETTLSQRLGNSETGDGRRFKGRGPIQLTGRANYRRFGDELNVDLVADPPRAAQPDVAFRVAGLFWSKKGLNELADIGTDEAFKEITRRINGGFNGLADRQGFYATARGVLGVAAQPRTRGGPAVPIPADESGFERGAEAIREFGRKAKKAKKAVRGKARKAKTAKAGRAKKGKATKAKARKAATGSRGRKTGRSRKKR